MRIKFVRDLEALRQIEKIYLSRGLTPVWAAPHRLEAYDKAGKLKGIAECS